MAAALLITLGIFLRFYHIDHKVFWDDEVIASMHILGITEREVVERAAEFRHVSDLRAVIHPASHNRTIADTVHTLITEDPQHPPLYYVAARIWVMLFGDSVTALRTLSAVISIAALPLMFWLCFELFGGMNAAWLGTALLAVSPLAVIFAQQVREYSLWLVAILVTSTLFLRALRAASIRSWILYAISVALSLYVFPASALVVFAHGIVAWLTKSSRRNRLYAMGAIAAGFTLFLPWLAVMLTHIGQIDKGMAVINAAGTSPLGVIRALVNLVRLDVIDLNGMQKHLVLMATVPIVGITAYALYAIRRFGTETNRIFVWATIGCTLLPFVVLDLISGGQRTASTRYFMPFFVVVDIALAGLFSARLAARDSPARSRRAWLIVLVILLGTRVASCAVSSQAQTWWSDYNNQSIAIAAEINHSPRPMIVSDDYIVWALALGEYVRPNVGVALAPRCYLCALPPAGQPDLALLSRPDAVGSVFLVAPSAALQQHVTAILSTLHKAPECHCINVRHNCAHGLRLF